MHPYFRKVNPDCTCFRVLFIYLDNENIFDAISDIFLESGKKGLQYIAELIKYYVLLTIKAFNTLEPKTVGLGSSTRDVYIRTIDLYFYRTSSQRIGVPSAPFLVSKTGAVW